MNQEIKSFTDLVTWQKAHQLMLSIYKLIELMPREEKFSRISQLKRSSSSVSANIAEGYGRFHYQENIQFCRQARGSLDETKNHIIAARDLEQLPENVSNKIIQQCEEVRMLLNGYIKSLQIRKNS